MKSMTKWLCYLLMVGTIAACSKEGKLRLAVDCDALITGLRDENRELVGPEIDALLQTPSIGATVGNGSSAGLDNLIERLRNNCGLSARLLCNSCIYTLPPQSEIAIRLDSFGSQITRIIDISMLEDGAMEFAGMHR